LANSALTHRDPPPSPGALVSGCRVGVVSGLLAAGVAALGTCSLTAGGYALAVSFLVGSVAGPLISWASRNRAQRTSVPITFSAMGTLAGVLLVPLLTSAVPPDLGLITGVGLPFAVLWGTPFWVLLGGPAGAALGMLAGVVVEFTPSEPGDAFARPLRAAAVTGALTTMALAPFWSVEVSRGLVMGAWTLAGDLGGWTMKFLASAVHAFGPLTLGLLAAIGAFGGAMLLSAREAWDRQETRPFLLPEQSFPGPRDPLLHS